MPGYNSINIIDLVLVELVLTCSEIRTYQSLKQTSTFNMNPDFCLTTITDEHLVPLDVLCRQLNTNIKNGISNCKVKEILNKDGKNKLKFNRNLFGEKSGSNISLSKLDKADPNFSKSEWKKIFRDCFPNEVAVIRDGYRRNIHAKHLVVGDIVLLGHGDIAPADLRMVYGENVFVDNRLITGNRCEERSHLNDFANQDCLLSSNMLFACTRILSGHCVAIVLKTGENTVFGTLKNFARKVKISATKRKSSTEETCDRKLLEEEPYLESTIL